MTCASCRERQRILAEARASGSIKQMAKAATLVGRHLLSHPPAPRKEDDGGDERKGMTP